jgi:hypothetical protein
MKARERRVVPRLSGAQEFPAFWANEFRPSVEHGISYLSACLEAVSVAPSAEAFLQINPGLRPGLYSFALSGRGHEVFRRRKRFLRAVHGISQLVAAGVRRGVSESLADELFERDWSVG